MPIAHSQGNYFVKSDDLKKIEDNDQIIFKYSSIFGDVSEKYNPNGSVSNIAGISNKKKNVMGLMPHPERAIENFYNGNDGIKFFENLKDLIWIKLPNKYYKITVLIIMSIIWSSKLWAGNQIYWNLEFFP